MTMDGLLEAYVCGGYGARLGDEVEYKFSLCENCLAELFKTFKHSPLVSDAEDECMKKEINDERLEELEEERQYQIAFEQHFGPEWGPYNESDK